MQVVKKYNTEPKKAVIFGTDQTYKKTILDVLASHLRQARDGDFTPGVKPVRGAYLHSDPPERLHDTKEDTDACYDSASGQRLKTGIELNCRRERCIPPSEYHVRYAQCYCARSEISFAQLQGMADEISCELVETNNLSHPKNQQLLTWKCRDFPGL